MEFRNNGYHPQWIHSLSGGHQIGAIQTPNGDQFSAHTNELYNVQPSCVESPSRLGIQVRNLAYTHRSKGTGLDSLESLFKPSKKSRGSKDILSDVNINIQRGSIYGLLGPSGECKLKGLEKPKQPTDAECPKTNLRLSATQVAVRPPCSVASWAACRSPEAKSRSSDGSRTQGTRTFPERRLDSCHKFSIVPAPFF